MLKRIHTTFALAAFLAPFAVVSAQRRLPLEIGVDGGVFRTSFNGGGSNTNSVTLLELPLRAIRLALPISSKAAFEPVAGFTRVTTDDGSSNSFALDLALLIELSEGSAPRWFLRPFVGFQQNSSSGLTSGRSSFGIGGGVRVALTDRISMRYEARYRHLPERGNSSGNVIGLLAGISVFTR